MSSKSFDNYAHLASDDRIENTEVSGRYAFQAEDEKRIVPDVRAKLDLCKEDTLLEIGSGPGTLLIPLSQAVNFAAAIDNAPVLDRMLACGGAEKKIAIYPGNFVEMDLPQRSFSKVLIYSVFHYLADFETALVFLERAISLLEPGGKLLVGDLPNNSKKERFLKTALGRKVSTEWSELISESAAHPLATLPADKNLLAINDAFIMESLALGREKGAETYLLPQVNGMPFCYTREDILFVCPK